MNNQMYIPSFDNAVALLRQAAEKIGAKASEEARGCVVISKDNFELLAEVRRGGRAVEFDCSGRDVKNLSVENLARVMREKLARLAEHAEQRRLEDLREARQDAVADKLAKHIEEALPSWERKQGTNFWRDGESSVGILGVYELDEASKAYWVEIRYKSPKVQGDWRVLCEGGSVLMPLGFLHAALQG